MSEIRTKGFTMRHAIISIALLVASCGTKALDTKPEIKSLFGGSYTPIGGVSVDWVTLGAAAYDRYIYDGTTGVAGDEQYLAAHVVSWCDELDGNDSSATICGGAHVSTNTSGGGVQNSGSSLRPSICILNTLTSATGASRVGTVRSAYSFHATDHSFMRALGVSLPVISDGTESYDAIIGFGDAFSPVEPVDGSYFLAHVTPGGGAGGVNSVNWQIGTAKASVRLRATLDGSTTDTVLRPVNVGSTIVVPETGEVDNFLIDCTTARCEFYMQRLGTDTTYVRVGSACSSGCSMAATSIPPAVTSVTVATPATGTFGVQAVIAKWAGSTQRNMTTDALCYKRTFSAAR